MKPIRLARYEVFVLSSRLSRSVPSIMMLPSVGSSRPEAVLSSVVLPQPEGPMMATISAGWTESETPRRA